MPKLLGYAPEDAVVMEMTKDGVSHEVDVPVDPELLAKMAEGDKDPMFVTIEVLNESTSRNGRKWDREAILRLVDQINSKKPDGYRGHIPAEDRKHKYPEPQTVWLGATATEVGGKLRLFAKGYVLPEAGSLRTYLRKAKAAGKNVAVSVYGTAARAVRGIADMATFDLESIDWARPGSEGVRNMGLLQVTAEMHDGGETAAIKGGDVMERSEVLKSTTASELEEHNPQLVQEMKDAALEGHEAPEEVVSEMTAIREVVGLDEKSEKSAAQVIQEMATRNNELELDAQLRDKVNNKAARKVIERIVVSEMKADPELAPKAAVDKVLKSATGREVVAEMIEKAPTVAPAIDKPAAQARRFTQRRDNPKE